MVLDLIRDQGGFREVRNEYGSRIGGNEGLDVSMKEFIYVQYTSPYKVG